MQAILGTRTSADLNLVAQILMLAALWIGFYLARTGQITKHKNVQTTVVVVNLFFILFIMMTSFYSFVILGGTTGGTVAQLMLLHGLLGLVTELTGLYLILRMRTHLIPPALRVRNFKLVMRITLGLWTLVALLGFGIYYLRYLAAPAKAGVPPIAYLQNQADGIALHAEELQAAAGERNNLATAKRHAEHLINLIEGRSGGDYGDADKDGIVEDPGDGVGAINYLQQVREEASRAGANNVIAVTIADHMHGSMIRVLADAKTVIQVDDLKLAAPQIAEIGQFAGQLNKGPANGVPQLAQALGVSAAIPPVGVQATPGSGGSGGSTVTVTMINFLFQPKTLTIPKGTTVVFLNRDNAKHTVTSDSGQFRSGDIGPGQSFSFKFDQAGVFPYFCEFHGDKGGVDMAGTILVQ